MKRIAQEGCSHEIPWTRCLLKITSIPALVFSFTFPRSVLVRTAHGFECSTCYQHRNHYRLGCLSRLPGISHCRHLLLALLWLGRLSYTDFHQSQTLHPRCGCLQLQQYRTKSLDGSISHESAASRCGGKWRGAVTSQANQNDVAKFKNADVIGHPGAEVFNEFIAGFGYTCSGPSQMLFPYLLSTLDTVGWRYNVPEVVYPEALIPVCGRSAPAFP